MPLLDVLREALDGLAATPAAAMAGPARAAAAAVARAGRAFLTGLLGVAETGVGPPGL